MCPSLSALSASFGVLDGRWEVIESIPDQCRSFYLTFFCLSMISYSRIMHDYCETKRMHLQVIAFVCDLYRSV